MYIVKTAFTGTVYFSSCGLKLLCRLTCFHTGDGGGLSH